jgi:hypothetical protein
MYRKTKIYLVSLNITAVLLVLALGIYWVISSEPECGNFIKSKPLAYLILFGVSGLLAKLNLDTWSQIILSKTSWRLVAQATVITVLFLLAVIVGLFLNYFCLTF